MSDSFPRPASTPQPDDQDPYLVAQSLVTAQRWDSALPAIAVALSGAPQDPRLLGLLVRTLRGLGRREEAVEAARRHLSIAPEDPYALRLACLCLLDVGWVDEAVGLATRAVAIDPQNAANHLALARAWGESGRPGATDQQLSAAREAIQLAPTSPDAHIMIGAALAASGDPAAARAAYAEALRIDPRSSAALNNLAVLDVYSGSHSAASRTLAAALAADPQDRVARHNLDVLAVRTLNRAAWWLLVLPIPALSLAAVDRSWAARALALVGLVIPPIIVTWWLAQLAPGHRQHLRTITGRIRARTWIWTALAGVAGLVGLLLAGLGPGLVRWTDVSLYVCVVLVLAVGRATVASARHSWQVEVRSRQRADRSGR